MDIDKIRKQAQEAIRPLRGVESPNYAPWGGYWTTSGEQLPEYYLVYFLLVDLLEFDHVGQFEKAAWGIPVDLDGYVLSIEYRKRGLGIVAYHGEEPEAAAAEIVRLINRGLPIAEPYFDWRAEQAAKGSEMNVLNRAPELHQRLEYLLALYEAKLSEYHARRDEITVEERNGMTVYSNESSAQLGQEARWLATSVIESFFSWTEHAFIHLAILQGRCLTADDARELAGSQWRDKFQAAFDLDDDDIKRYYDALNRVRTRTRNFVAHGAFGKDGDAFQLHSTAGAIPVRLVRGTGTQQFRFGRTDLRQTTDDREDIALIKEFMAYVRSGPLEPAWLYIDLGGPANLVEAREGRYLKAMSSVEAMRRYAEEWEYLADMYMNFDFPT